MNLVGRLGKTVLEASPPDIAGGAEGEVQGHCMGKYNY